MAFPTHDISRHACEAAFEVVRGEGDSVRVGDVLLSCHQLVQELVSYVGTIDCHCLFHTLADKTNAQLFHSVGVVDTCTAAKLLHMLQCTI